MTIDKQELQRLCDAASPGPWTAYGCSVEGPSLNIYDEGGHTEADAEFIAAARTALPALLAELTAVTAERDEMRNILIDLKEWDYASIAGFSPIPLYLRRRMQGVIDAFGPQRGRKGRVSTMTVREAPEW